MTELEKNQSKIESASIAASLYRWSRRNRNKKILKYLPSGWRNNYYSPQTENYNLTVTISTVNTNLKVRILSFRLTNRIIMFQLLEQEVMLFMQK